MAAVFDFLGALIMTIFNANVAQTIFNMVDFGENAKNAIIAHLFCFVCIYANFFIFLDV